MFSMSKLQMQFYFLSTLDCNGYKYFIESEVLKVSKGVLVVMKVKKLGRLYALQGCMVTGAATALTSPIFDVDIIKL